MFRGSLVAFLYSGKDMANPAPCTKGELATNDHLLALNRPPPWLLRPPFVP